MPKAKLTLNQLRDLAKNEGRRLADLAPESEAFKAVTAIKRREKLLQGKEAVPELPDALADAMTRLDDDEVVAKPALDLLERVLADARLAREEKARLEKRLAEAKARKGDRDTDVPEPDAPLREVPGLETVVERARVAAITQISGLADSVAEQVVESVPALGLLNEQRLGTLVIKGVLEEGAARRLGTVGETTQLLGGDTETAGRVVGTPFRALRRRIERIVDVLDIPSDELAQALDPESVRADPEAARAKASDFKRRIEECYPNVGLARRLSETATAVQRGSLNAVHRLIARRPEVLAADPAELDLGDREAEALADARRAVNAYPGLGLDRILSKSRSAQEAARSLAERIRLVDEVVAKHADRDLLNLDFSPGSKDVAALGLDRLPEADRTAVLSTLKARARVYHIAGDVARAAQVMQGGFHSAVTIAGSTAETIARRTGIPLPEARVILENAKDARASVTNLVGTLVDELRWNLPDVLWSTGGGEDVTDGLRRLPGYEDLFGAQSFCDCGHCDSILSPAAYFVDLMNFVDAHVTGANFTGDKADHALKLRNRRPDLWTLPLTCANTHDLVPTLEIINEILETAIARRHDPDVEVTDRAGIARIVYHRILAEAERSFVTPFDLRVAAADSFISEFGTDRAQVLDLLRPDASRDARNAAALKLSMPAYQAIITPQADRDFLNALYRMTFRASGSRVRPFDVQEIMAGMEISRAEIGALVESRFVTGDGSLSIRITSEKRDGESVQNDIEKIAGLTVEALDRMQRLWRLKAAIGWDVDTLDAALARVGGDLDSESVAALVAIRDIAERFGFDIDQTLALSGPIPEVPVGGKALSLMDRLFNDLSGDAGAPFPAPALRFVHPGLRDDAVLPESGPNAGAFVSQRLRAALGLSESALLELILAFAPSLGLTPDAADPAERGFALDADNLALVYRHALLAKALGLDFDALALLIRAATGEAAITRAEHLDAVLAFADRTARMPYSLAEIGALMGLMDDPAAEGIFLDPRTVAEGVVAEIARGERRAFAPTVFAVLDGVSEDQSKAIVAANAGLFEKAGRGMLRLKIDVGLSPGLAAPPDGFPLSVSVADLERQLAAHNVRTLLPAQLAAALDISETRFAALAAFAGLDLASAPVFAALDGGDPAALEAEVAKLQRPLSLLGDAAVGAESVTFAAANRRLFATDDPTAPLSRDAVIAFAAFVAALRARPDDTAPSVHGEAVHSVLAAHDADSGFSAADTAALAQATDGDPGTVRVFAAAIALPAQALYALDRLRHVIGFARERGLGVEAMALLGASDPDALEEAAESLIATLRLKLGDESAFESVVETHRDALRGRKRDALVDYLIRNSEGRFENISDLYSYYLIDPEMAGCARTSRVVSAVGSVQTYVHRILLNLEQDRRGEDHSGHVHVSPSSIPKGEWEWRKNYRVWEANRKVFLWPENYMQPSLRDDKTPLFEQLEQTLLQQDITEQTVLDAYAAYLKGFEEVASLRIAGAHHEFSWAQGIDVLHVFGCTADDPPQYYYWTIENPIFGKLKANRRVAYSVRRKIDVAIGARDVAPMIYNNRLHLFWVEVSTAPDNVIEDGENKFRGYRHTYKVKYSALRLDGTWSAPQELSLGRSIFLDEGGVLHDPLSPRISGNFSSRVPVHAEELIPHGEYQEGYTLRAPAASMVYPVIRDGRLFLNLGARHQVYEVDMFDRRAFLPDSDTRGTLRKVWRISRQAFHAANARLYEQTITGSANIVNSSADYATRDFVKSDEALLRNLYGSGRPESMIPDALSDLNLASEDLGASIARINADDVRVIVPNSTIGLPEILVQKETDISYVGFSFDFEGRPYESRRLGSTVLEELNRKLFYGGVAKLLAKETQKGLAEKAHLVTSLNYKTQVVGPTDGLDFTGPLGVYFREIFMYIPALLAAHHNARGDYAAAQAWYATIFDPTAEPDGDIDLESLSPAARRQAERDRVWQYAEFHGLRPARLREILTDDGAQAAYREDPFNPYAIARLRLSAFQKNIVMRYVENLLDWGDSLFRQFQRETVDEAHVLYDMARQILGPRPADVGDCGEGAITPRSYEKIAPRMEAGSDFLIEVENIYFSRVRRRVAEQAVPKNYIGVQAADIFAAEARAGLESVVSAGLRHDAGRPPSRAKRVASVARGGTEKMFGDDLTVRALPDAPTAQAEAEPLPEHLAAKARYHEALAEEGVIGRQMTWNKTGKAVAERAGPRATGRIGRNWRDALRSDPDEFTISVIRQVGPVFCVPRNKDLLALWDRVEDRLYKIHNCLNIDGERVDLALFAPEIDPNALVRARAAGLSLGDVLGGGATNLPPYRFTYLIAKAREYTSLVQGFGAKLQGAIERKDAEELAVLRATQAANMQALVTRIREKELQIAQDTLEELKRRKAAVEYRRGHYDEQIGQDLNAWERTQQTLTHASTVSYVTGALLGGTAGVLHLIPQLGSPFAMKYGGQELGSSAENWSKVFSDTAKLTDVMSKSAALEAGFARRREGWEHQRDLDDHELRQIEKKISAAKLRVEIAERALANHEKAIEDQQEILDFYQSRFTNLDLYTWLSSELQSLYRNAFNAAFAMAKLAEHAYRFERPADSATLLAPTYWEGGRAGLLSGERLSVDLVEMEKRYIETNYRALEISQPFSLRQIDPAALMRLRATGEAEFAIPELAYDLLYPGHYRRRIRSARLSVACVTGPYVNIPATLTLTGAKIRLEPTPDGAAGLSDSPLRHTVQIATSTAQNDAGVLDFSFSDPRYMPFEGAGAVESGWSLALPKNFRPFNYDTITDVILHISYTAESDGALRERVEAENAGLEGALAKVLSETPLPVAFSLRQEFSTAFNQIKTLGEGMELTVTLDERALPLPLRAGSVTIARAVLLLKPGEGADATGTTITLNDQPLTGFASLPEFPGYLGTGAQAALAGGLLGDHRLSVTDAGGLAPDEDDATAAIADGALEDLVLYVELTLG